MTTLEIKDLHVQREGKLILKGVNLKTGPGEVHAIMGPNGSGKSTLAYTLLAHPKYEVTKGDILLDGQSILDLSTDERAKRGLFLGFQYPTEVSGVGYSHFLRTAYNALSKSLQGSNREVFITVREFQKYLKDNLHKVGLQDDFLTRYLNEGFSGGEKKKAEMLQMLSLKPKYAIMDETDSGLDVDALKTVANAAESIARDENTQTGVLVITHYPKLLEYLKPDKVLVLKDGIIVATGGSELVTELEKTGFEGVENA